MIRTMNSCSRTSPMLIRYLSRCQVSSARCQSPWVSLAPLSMDMLSSSHRAALLHWNSAASREQHSRQRLLQLYQKRRGGVQPLRLQITQAAGCPMRGTHLNMITSQRMTCRMQRLSHQYPSRRLLLFCLSSKETLQHRLNSFLILLLQILTVTQRSHHLCQRRKTNTVSKFLFGFYFYLSLSLQLLCFWWPLSNGDPNVMLLLTWDWVSKTVTQWQRRGREVSVLWQAGSDSWSQEWSRPRGAALQSIFTTVVRPFYFSVYLSVNLWGTLPCRSSWFILLFYVHSFPPPPFCECFPVAEKNWVLSKSLEKGLLFCPKPSIARAVIWQ